MSLRLLPVFMMRSYSSGGSFTLSCFDSCILKDVNLHVKYVWFMCVCCPFCDKLELPGQDKLTLMYKS
jgi:hypothetical protein